MNLPPRFTSPLNNFFPLHLQQASSNFRTHTTTPLLALIHLQKPLPFSSICTSPYPLSNQSSTRRIWNQCGKSKSFPPSSFNILCNSHYELQLIEQMTKQGSPISSSARYWQGIHRGSYGKGIFPIPKKFVKRHKKKIYINK